MIYDGKSTFTVEQYFLSKDYSKRSGQYKEERNSKNVVQGYETWYTECRVLWPIMFLLTQSLLTCVGCKMFQVIIIII